MGAKPRWATGLNEKSHNRNSTFLTPSLVWQSDELPTHPWSHPVSVRHQDPHPISNKSLPKQPSWTCNGNKHKRPESTGPKNRGLHPRSRSGAVHVMVSGRWMKNKTARKNAPTSGLSQRSHPLLGEPNSNTDYREDSNATSCHPSRHIRTSYTSVLHLPGGRQGYTYKVMHCLTWLRLSCDTRGHIASILVHQWSIALVSTQTRTSDVIAVLFQMGSSTSPVAGLWTCFKY